MHWTYETFQPESDLEQGDIVFPTPELTKVLESVHPHFCDRKYLGFTVTTQSCDLVQRKTGSKAVYVNLATVRSLRDVLPRLLASVAAPVASNLFRSSAKADAKRLFERLFNQNEQGLGLFYFHQDADVGLGESAVAFLRVTVSLRVEHYEILTKARRGRLNAEFRAKFGWLLGNLYSRAATQDWQDVTGGKQLLNAMIREQITELDSAVKWVDDAIIDAGIANAVDFQGRQTEELLAELERLRPKPAIDVVVDEVSKQVQAVFPATNEADLRKLRNRLKNSGPLAQSLRK